MIKTVDGFKITKIAFFISKNSVFHLIHEFFDLEEIFESMPEIYTNLKSLTFKLKKNLQYKNIFTILKIRGAGKVLSKDLIMPLFIKSVVLNQYLFRIISSFIKINILIELEV